MTPTSQPLFPSPLGQRVIRVFVSSTFRDMRAERDELVLRIFPQLRKLCESRGVTWGEVDLRWGITDEQRAEGKVLPICLEEIHRCRPYFIGLLGQRYGWIADDIPAEVIERETWLREHVQNKKSVTELEILHGVLNNPAMAKHAFFYFRDPKYVETVPPEQRQNFTTEDTASTEKLRQLKKRIKDTGFPLRENYADPKELSELVLKDLSELINRVFPDEPLDPLNLDAAEHQAFAQSRAKVYIGRKEYFDRLNQFLETDSGGKGLVVLGGSGSGKSALLANWALKYMAESRGQRSEVSSVNSSFLLLHFIGATPYSSDWAAMLRRIMGEFKRRFGIEQEIPDKPDALRSAFANWLHMASAKVGATTTSRSSRIILILDALNQLQDRDSAPDLVWLPPVIPENVRLILSALPGRPLDDLKKRGWPTLEIKPLEPNERQQLITDYLAQYTKSLSPDRADRIARSPQTANPLYLRALLEELRLYGDHFTLDQRINHYLTAVTVDDLYEQILERYEQDYERDRPGLVRDAMSALWTARRGLSEAELLELLGSNGQPLPRAHWSPLYLAADQSLVSRSGLIGFGHDYFRQAVQDKYLPTASQQAQAHLRLANYFEAVHSSRERMNELAWEVADSLDFDAPQLIDQRKFDELPWQCAEACAWQRLYTLLADRHFFNAAWQYNEFEVKSYWVRIENSSPCRMVEAYRRQIENPRAEPDKRLLWRLGILLDDTDRRQEALSVRGSLADHFRQSGNKDKLRACLGNQAAVLTTLGRSDAAMTLHKEEERLCRELRNGNGLAFCLGNQAIILQQWGRLDEAMKLLKETEQLCRELANREGLQKTLGNVAVILFGWGRYEEAFALLREAARLCRELGDKSDLQNILNNQTVLLKEWGRLDEALTMAKEAERICRELGDKRSLGSCLENQAVILKIWGRLDEAMSLHKEVERLCREIDYKYGLIPCLNNQALILKACGRLDEAMALFKEAERLCREIGFKDGLRVSLGSQANMLNTMGRLDEAMTLHKEEERLCRELRSKDGLQKSLGNQAVILYARGRLEEAMALFKEKELLCRELGNKDGLWKSLSNQAGILQSWGRLDEALAMLEEVARLCRELRSAQGLSTSLMNQAVVLAYKMERFQEALPLAEEAYRVSSSDGLTQHAVEVKAVLDGILAKLGNKCG